MKAAGQVFKLAVGLNFIQGRRTKTVAAVCLYIACRRQDGNTVMLIDLADVLMVSSPHDPSLSGITFTSLECSLMHLSIDQCVQVGTDVQGLVG
jgi:transcription initiation factor TFIIIB Brf1 subunit/transcription initiation factor TFIIB